MAALLLILSPTLFSTPINADLLHSPNRLIDPGFESGELQFPFIDAFRGTVAIDQTTALTGASSLRLSATEAHAYTIPWQNAQKAAVIPLDGYDQDIRFTAWAKTSAANTRLRMYIFCLDENYSHQDLSHTYQRFWVGTDWQSLSLEYTCPQATSYVGIRLQNEIAGRDSWWDDLSLTLGAPTSNLLLDGGFENGQTRVPFESMTGGSLTIDESNAFIGESALKLTTQPGAANSETIPSSGSRQAVVVPLDASNIQGEFVFSLWAKAAIEGTRTSLAIVCLDSTYQVIEEGERWQSIGQEWRPYFVSQQCPSNAAFLSLKLEIEGGFRTLWVDEARLVADEPWVNLMRNPGMESPTLALPFTGAVHGRLAVDNSVSFAGQSSLRFESVEGDAYTLPWAQGALAPLLKLENDNKVELSAWVKGDHPDILMSITIFCWDEGYNPMTYPWNRAFFTIGTEWQKVNTAHGCPGGAFAGARFDIKDAQSVVWFDEVSFYDLDAFARANEPGGDDLLPSNLEFEGARGLITNNAFFSDTNIDNINLMTGNLVASLPIGQRFQIGPSFDFGLVLTYNSNAWSSDAEVFTPQDSEIKGVPRIVSNAGFGWQLSLGALYKSASKLGGAPGSWPNRTDSEWLYIAPDGSQIFFTGRAESSYFHALDGGQARLSETGATMLLEFSDGTSQTFALDGSVACPEAGGCYRPTLIKDAFNNWLAMDYSQPNLWHLSDIHGRHFYVEFQSGSAVNGGTSEFGDLKTRVSKVRLPSFDSNEEAEYIFHYDNKTTLRGCPIGGNTASAMDMPFLGRLSMPQSGYEYDFAYRLEGNTSTIGLCSNASGLLNRITTPSHGVIGYHYAPAWELPSTCEFATNNSDVDSDVVKSFGVIKRSLYENVANAPDPTIPGDEGHPDSWQRFKQHLTERETPFRNSSAENCNRYNLSITDVISSPVDDKYRIERHYHTVTRTRRRTPTTGEWRVADYGLPISKADEHRIDDPNRAGSLYLSREILSSSDSLYTSTEVERQIYRRYALKLKPKASCHELLDDPSCFRDDSQIYGELTYYGDRYIHQYYEDYDGLGHFRREIVTSDFPSHSEDPTQTTFTNFTKNPGSLAITPEGEIDDPLPTPNSPWLLNLFNYQEKKLDNRIERQDFEFEPSTGFLRCTRTYAETSGISPQPRDIAVVYTAGTPGFPILEEYAGGDKAPNLHGGALCGADSVNMEYRLQHQYTFGQKSLTQYINANGGQIGPKILDLDIDPTGLPRRSRDHSTSPVMTTDFSFDKMARKTGETRKSGNNQSPLSTVTLGYHLHSAAAGGGWVNYKVESGFETIDHLRLFYDGLGRETDLMGRAEFLDSASSSSDPTDGWIRQSRYYQDGVLASITTTQPDGDFNNALSHRRRFKNYDVHGRLLKIVEPDDLDHQGSTVQEIADFNYFGGAIHRKVSKKAGIKSETFFDAFGRAHLEKANALQSSCSGEEQCNYYRILETHYSATGTRQTLIGGSSSQMRRKWIDGRGYLTRELMPEKTTGFSPNEADIFYQYDSRGQMTRMTEGTLDLTYLYDGAERLQEVLADGRTYKKFIHNDQGKISEATRFTYYDNANTFGFTSFFGNQAVAEVVEIFQYNRIGLVSDRSTRVGLTLHTQLPATNPEVIREVDQHWQWDDVGRLVSMNYGSGWSGFKTPPPPRVSTYAYAYRLIDEISSAGELSVEQSYFPNGMPARIRYFGAGGNIDSTDRVATTFNFRPRFKGVTAEDSAGQTIAETGFYNYDGRGLIRSIIKPTNSLLYDYDRSGRIERYRTTSASNTLTEQINYDYDHFDNMIFSGEDGTSITVESHTNRLMNAGGQPVIYDDRGQMLQYGSAHMSWDPFGEQIAWAAYDGAIQPPNTAPEDFYYQSLYLYNASDERVMLFERTGDNMEGPPNFDFAVNIFMLRDLTGNIIRELREEENENITHGRDHIWSGRSLRAVIDDGELQFTHLDHLGNPRILTGSSFDNESYRPFGTQYGDGPGMRVGYTGHEQNRNAMNRDQDRDGVGMTYDMRAREYSPGLSRFLTVDPAQDGWNLYTYTRNNPVVFWDPTGEATAMAIPSIAVGGFSPPPFLAGAGPAAVIVGGGLLGVEIGREIGGREALPGLTVDQLISDYTATEFFGGPDGFPIDASGLPLPILASRPGEYDSQIAQHAVDAGHFAGKTAGQVLGIIEGIRENGRVLKAANGNQLTVDGDKILIDDLLSEGSAGTTFRPPNVKKFVEKWLKNNGGQRDVQIPK